MRSEHEPVFLDARGMHPRDIVTYDASKEGTGERKEGAIKEISRSFLSLVLEDGTAIGVARVYSCRSPIGTGLPQPAPGQSAKKPWFIRSDEDDEPPPRKYISIPF